MTNQPLINFLKASNIISASNAAVIASSFLEKTIIKNQLHLESGKIANEYLFLESGFMRSFAFDTDGREVSTNFYVPGQVVIEVASFFNRTPSKENIEASMDCKGWFITYSQLNELFHSNPEFREFGRSVLVKALIALKNKMLTMITETAEERYAQLLLHQPLLLQNVPLKQLASYLGITDTSLSRIRKNFSRKK